MSKSDLLLSSQTQTHQKRTKQDQQLEHQNKVIAAQMEMEQIKLGVLQFDAHTKRLGVLATIFNNLCIASSSGKMDNPNNKIEHVYEEMAQLGGFSPKQGIADEVE